MTIFPSSGPLADESKDPVPDWRLELPPPPSALTARAVPARPHVAAPPSVENNVASKPEPPVIAPHLTPAETTAARQQMLVSLNVAEKNLARSQGKKLNGTQADLAAKVKGFIGDARSAEHDGDWTRARSLATKAQVLSEELVASL
jgi:2-keto-4-pentenoate hydratase